MLFPMDDYVLDWLRENPQDGQDFCQEVNSALWKHIRECWISEPKEEWKRIRQCLLRERKENVERIMRRMQSGAPGLSANTEQGATP